MAPRTQNGLFPGFVFPYGTGCRSRRRFCPEERRNPAVTALRPGLRRATLLAPRLEALAHFGSPPGFTRVARRHTPVGHGFQDRLGVRLNDGVIGEVDPEWFHVLDVHVGEHR